MNSYEKVTESESKAYGTLKTNLNIGSDDNLLNFIKVKTIGKYNQKNLIVAMEDLNSKSKWFYRSIQFYLNKLRK